MINVESLTRQHNALKDEINLIEVEAEKDSSSMNVAEAALHISRLAGLIKMHLMEEDKFLYPNLIKCSDNEIQLLANQYNNEMGDLADKYIEYKNSYNVASKITAKIDAFTRDTRYIMKVLKTRIEKENNELYQLIRDRKL